MCITEAAVQRCSWEKVFWKYASKFTRERPCRSVTSIKLLCNFIEILLQHRCSPVNLLHFSRTPPKNTSGWLLLFCKKIILHPTNCNIPARQWLWTSYMDIYVDILSINFIYCPCFAWFLHHLIIKKLWFHNKLVKNMSLSNITRVLFFDISRSPSWCYKIQSSSSCFCLS